MRSENVDVLVIESKVVELDAVTRNAKSGVNHISSLGSFMNSVRSPSSIAHSSLLLTQHYASNFFLYLSLATFRVHLDTSSSIDSDISRQMSVVSPVAVRATVPKTLYRALIGLSIGLQSFKRTKLSCSCSISRLIRLVHSEFCESLHLQGLRQCAGQRIPRDILAALLSLLG